MSLIKDALARYPDVPRSVVLKYEFSRAGLASSDRARMAFPRLDTSFKGHLMFSWDTGKRRTRADKTPELLLFKRDGTLLANRTNDGSPYVLDEADGRFVIKEAGQEIEEIEFPRAPRYYSLQTSGGIDMPLIVHKVGCMLFTTVNKYCEFWKDNTECQFCDFMEVTRDQAKTGELGASHRTADQVAEVLHLAIKDPLPVTSKHWLVSGGALLTMHSGKTEIDYYCEHLETVFRKLGKVFPTGLQIVPPNTEGWKRLKEVGLVCVQPNMEVWDREKFKWICPGKDKYIGYDEYLRRMLAGVDVFGPGKVNPNFVIGVEMAKPFGFSDPGEAAESTLSGFEFLMRNGVFPRAAVWLPEQGSALRGQGPPPLEYFIRFGRGYRDLRHRYGFGDDLHVLCRGCNAQDTLHDWDYAEPRAPKAGAGETRRQGNYGENSSAGRAHVG